MQKISGILPANARVTTVDMKASGSARPGMPNWGREVGVPYAAEKKMQADAAVKATIQHKDMMQLRKENGADPHTAIVQQMADKFFVARLQAPKEEPVIAADPDSDMALSTTTKSAEPVEVDYAAEGTSDLRAIARPAQPAAEVATSEPKDDSTDDGGETLMVGQYLDVHA